MAVVTMNGITFEPTIEVTDGTSLDLTYDDQVVINGISSVTCNFNVTDTGGQSIQEFVVYNGSVEHAGADGVVNIPTVYNGSFTFKITTTTGVTAIYSIRVREIPYSPITCGVEVSDVTFTTETLATVRFRVKGRYYTGSLGIKNNSVTMEYSYYIGTTPPSTRTWTRVTPTTSGYNFSANIDIGTTYTDLINFEVRVLDEITNNSASYKYRVTPVFDWSETDFNFNVPITYKGVELPMVDEIGSNRYWEWKKYSDGTAELWATVSLVGQGVATQWGSSGWYTSGSITETNIPFPFEFTKTPTMVASLVPGYAGAVLMSTGDSSIPLSSTSTGTYELARGTPLNSASYKICYYVRGYWK